MKIIKPSVEFFGAVPTEYEGAVEFIERCGRLCYKSEDKITPTSAEGFVKRLIKAGHLAMVEHSNFVVRAKARHFVLYPSSFSKYLTPYGDENYYYVGGNLTAWIQNYNRCKDQQFFAPFLNIYGKLFDLDYDEFGVSFDSERSHWQPCPSGEIPKELHRYSAKFICDRGVSHELVRHRPCSFAQESTRYVNYAGKEMEFLEPAGFEDWTSEQRGIFRFGCSASESAYKDLITWHSLKPQQARAVLPNALKTEIVVTADAAEWAHIRKLRTSPAAQPDTRRVMGLMPWEEFL